MKFLLTVFFLFSFFFFISCTKQEDSDAGKSFEEQSQIEAYMSLKYPGVQPTASGLYYIPNIEGRGDKPNDNDFVIISYNGKTLDGKIFDSTDPKVVLSNSIVPLFALGGPLKLSMKVNIPGWVESLKMMNEGGSAIAVMPATLVKFYDYVPRIYEFHLEKVIHNIAEYEKEQIEAYVTAKGKTFADSTDGIYYFETANGTGVTPSNGKRVTVSLTGKLIDGRIFDHVDTITFTLGQKQSYGQGFEQAVMKTKKGGQATVVVPYYRAYGADVQIKGNGQILIPWYSTLLFDIKVVNIL
jgi:FKBP-type peptidyl-prolyl cis-trans isomerase